MTDFSQYPADPWGYAIYLIDVHGSRLRYATDINRFYKYTGSHWQECGNANVEIGKTINAMSTHIRENMPPQPDKDSPDYYAWHVQATFVKLAGNATGTSAIISKMKEDDRIWCYLNDFVTKPHLINFRTAQSMYVSHGAMKTARSRSTSTLMILRTCWLLS
jgi:hypothetical protein